MAECLSQLDGNGDIRGISIQAALHQLRTNARLAKIDLPERFTVPRDHPDYAKWRAEIEAYRKLAFARLKTKNKANKALARETA